MQRNDIVVCANAQPDSVVTAGGLYKVLDVRTDEVLILNDNILERWYPQDMFMVMDPAHVPQVG